MYKHVVQSSILCFTASRLQFKSRSMGLLLCLQQNDNNVSISRSCSLEWHNLNKFIIVLIAKQHSCFQFKIMLTNDTIVLKRCGHVHRHFSPKHGFMNSLSKSQGLKMIPFFIESVLTNLQKFTFLCFFVVIITHNDSMVCNL